MTLIRMLRRAVALLCAAFRVAPNSSKTTLVASTPWSIFLE